MEQISMFDVMEEREHTAPLASRLRPETLDEFAGQKQRALFCGGLLTGIRFLP